MRLTPAVSALAVAGLLVGSAAGAASAGPAAPVRLSHVDLELSVASGALQPTAAVRAAATQAAESLGLHVDATHASYLTVSGPSGLVSRVFPPTSPGKIGGVLAVPSALQATVLGATDDDDTRPFAQAAAPIAPQKAKDSEDPIASYDTSQLAQDYSGAAPGGYTHVAPVITPQTPVIATMQLAGFDQASFEYYAQNVAFPKSPGYDPVASGQFVAVGVDRTAAYDPSVDNDSASSEFALDAEAILGAAPEARQRAYVATNTASGALRAVEGVLDDVTAGVPIVAFSSSWGSCEPANSLFFIQQLEGIMKRLNAAGVTMFAASGDDGLRDCAAEDKFDAEVDYPASSPQVVGVGGTEHPGGGLIDSAWSDLSYGTGGGTSRVFSRPSWQAGVGNGAARMVPDIAVDADRRTGFRAVLPSHSESGESVSAVIVGGTSLASPLAAAMLTNIEVAHGFAGGTHGLGDIHRQLYTASTAAPGSITDVATVIDNSAGTIQAATPGYDKATGLGTPVWSALAPVLYAPAPAAPAAPKVTIAHLTPTGAQVSFAEPAGVDATGWYVDNAHSDAGCVGNPLHKSALVQLPMGKQVLAIHSIGANLVCSKAKTVTVYVGQDDRSGKRSRGWALKHDKSAFGGTYAQASKPGATVTWNRIDGRVYDVLLDRQKAAGVAQILIDGKVVRTLSVGSTKDHWALKTTVSAKAHGKHTITVRVLSGTVRVDGLLLH